MRLVLFISVIVMLAACGKQELNIELTPHQNKKLTIEGTITDSTQQQIIKCSYTTDFGDSLATTVTDANIKVYTDEGVYSYSHLGSGAYVSDVAFAGIYGQDYEVVVEHDGNSHVALTKMPSPVYLDSVSVYRTSTGLFSSTQVIDLTLGSEADQFIRYKLYQREITGADSVWQEIPIPVYWVTPVIAAPNQIIELPVEENYLNLSGDIKLEVYSLSSDIGYYLLELSDYMKKELPNSQFHNPPYFYSNEAYGMFYGMCRDTIYYFVE